MKKYFSIASVCFFLATQAMAGSDTLVGDYSMTWGNGVTATYTILEMTATSAKVTYSYDGKSKTKVLKVKNGKIRGGGWFPTVKIKGGSVSGASHSGSSAKVQRK